MRNNFSKFALTAILGFALAFTFSCSDDDGGTGIAYGPPMTYEGKTYKTVIIGGQTWMAENLNYAVEGSKCKDDNEANCVTYGRLYDWATAMGVSSSYNSGYYHPSSDHRGICPAGWHLPSVEEWGALIIMVGGNDIAGTKLKATSGWNYPLYGSTSSGNGTDDYGFSALPNDGYIGRWWSTTEYLAPLANVMFMSYNSEAFVTSTEENKMNFYSVRCVQNSSHSNVSSSSSAITNVEVIYGPSVSYEGTTYKTVVIGTQTWMAENLNYTTEGSKCNDCDTYGGLYSWATAMALPDSCNLSSCSSQIGAKHKGICPSGWHIPSRDEWETLMDFAGGGRKPMFSTSYERAIAGEKLKATSGWIGNNNGTDDYGFAALPGGFGDDSSDGGVGLNCYWWAATQYNYTLAWQVEYQYEFINSVDSNKKNFFSVRCLQD